MRVEWDEAKNLANQRKHGISFEEAQELFAGGADYLEIFDETHSESEDRFIARPYHSRPHRYRMDGA